MSNAVPTSSRGIPFHQRRRPDSELSQTVFGLKPSLDDADDRQLSRAIADAKLGGREGFDYLYHQYADNVYSYVRTIVRDDHSAEDITQQVFAKLLVKISAYEQRAVPFAAWLLRISRNCAIDQVRRNRTICVEEVVKVEEAYDETGKELRSEISDALLELSHNQRHVLVMRHFIGLSPREIATQIGKSEGAVHTLHHRARRRLRDELIKRSSAPASIPEPHLAA